MNREKAQKILNSYGRPGLKLGKTNIVFSISCCGEILDKDIMICPKCKEHY